MFSKLFKPQVKPYLIRLGYRKCLTHYMDAVFDKNRHYFHSQRKGFVEHLETQKPGRFISINNNVFWPERKIFQNARMVHLIRHPKDIVISSYFYHKKGSEQWTIEPIFRLWLYRLAFELDHMLNDNEKKLLDPRLTYQHLLENLPLEKGMIAEMILLKFIHTFNPIPFYQSPIIQTFRFEEMVNNMEGSIQQICQSWQLSEEETVYYTQRAAHFDQNPNYEIRDRSAYQYKKYFNKTLNHFFAQQFPNVAKRLDYPD